MRITLLAPHLKVAGGTRAMLTYADLLAKRGHKVQVVVPLANPLRRAVWNLLRVKPGWMRDTRFSVKRVPDYSEKHIPDGDITIATAWVTARDAALYGPEKGRKFYFIQHYESLYHGETKETDKTYRLPLKKIVISKWLQGIMKDEFNSESTHLLTPVDKKLFHYVEGQRQEKPIRVLMLYHEAKWKGVEIGSRVFERVKKEFPEIELVLFGVRKEIADISHGKYFYKPEQEKLAKIYSSCHIYLCPSEYEGLGMPAMEAMASRGAVVTFDTGGSWDYAIDGKTALVAKHGDEEDLYRKLKIAVEDSALREKIARGGYDFIQTIPTWDEQTTKLETLFRGALD